LILDGKTEKVYTVKAKHFEIFCTITGGQACMNFLYDRKNCSAALLAPTTCYLLTNGLGGYSSMTGVFSAPRADQGILIAAVTAPNERICLVHRLREMLDIGGELHCLSTQEFADGTAPEDGFLRLSRFSYEYMPQWEYDIAGIRIQRQCAMTYGSNTAAVLYTAENTTDTVATLSVSPFFKFAPKEAALTAEKALSLSGNSVTDGTYTLYINTNGSLTAASPQWQYLSYPEDAKDGRPDRGLAGSCCRIDAPLPAGSTVTLEIVFSDTPQDASAQDILQAQKSRMNMLAESCGFDHPIARQLAVSADAYIANRDSTGGKTILAGYPLFSDWGRDTMIALPGCTLSTGRYKDAKSILRTFLTYEKDGLVPNLFPEGGCEPMYNTVDAALLLIDCVWQYLLRRDDREFLQEAWPVMKRIIHFYQTGTHHGIGMDEDGLIFAGQGLDQVTWMDVRINDILPTPRHGKPVEINAYWYNALRIMAALAPQMDEDSSAYTSLAEKVKDSFTEKFYMADKGYLKDVLSGTAADAQLRCNQIWALSMPFTMLEPWQERHVLQAVTDHLLNHCGLRTLSPKDPQYHPYYGGSQFDRDMAYHQGTTWVFPMGAYWRAYLRLNGNTSEAARDVKLALNRLLPMLQQGCAGQLPEIYDGDRPYIGKGCFAQAWSVGEMLRVYEDIQQMETSEI